MKKNQESITGCFSLRSATVRRNISGVMVFAVTYLEEYLFFGGN